MTAKEMLNELNKMTNQERNKYLDQLYEEYFKTASPEQLQKDAEILEAYYNGELIKVESDGY